MASTFPTSLDTFTNPTATSLLTSPSHAQQHSDINDAVEALEAKVAIGNTVLGTYTAYTPTYTGITVGNGTTLAQFCRVNNFVHCFGSFTLGSTSAVTGSIGISAPVNVSSDYSTMTNSQIGTAGIYDVSAGTTTGFFQAPILHTSATEFRLRVSQASGTYVQSISSSSTVPMTWATGDIITYSIYYKAA